MNATEMIALVEKEPEFQEYFMKIPKRNKSRKSLYLETLNRLAYLFYIEEQVDLAEKLLQQISQISFAGNFNEWTFVERSIALLAFIERESPAKVKRLKGLILEKLLFGTESKQRINQTVHQRFLAGATLEARLAEITQAPNLLSATEYRFAYLGDLFKLYLFHEEACLSVNQIMERIEEETRAIRAFLADGHLTDLFPFKTR